MTPSMFLHLPTQFTLSVVARRPSLYPSPFCVYVCVYGCWWFYFKIHPRRMITCITLRAHLHTICFAVLA